MTDTILTISSKNYSSWSLRGWLLCRMAGLKFVEEVVPVADPANRAELLLLSPSILVPAATRRDRGSLWPPGARPGRPAPVARRRPRQAEGGRGRPREPNDDRRFFRRDGRTKRMAPRRSGPIRAATSGQAINGLPSTGSTFLPGKPVDPSRPIMMATIMRIPPSSWPTSNDRRPR